MGFSTQIKLRGRIPPGDIAEFLRRTYGTEVEWNVKETTHCPLNQISFKFERNQKNIRLWKTDDGFINFIYAGMPVSLFYFYSNILLLDDLEAYKGTELDELASTETTTLILDYSNYSLDIATELAVHYGGWVDENDCDKIPYIEYKRSN